MKPSITFFLLSCISAFVHAGTPDLFSIRIGEAFPKKSQFESDDPNRRPTIQFKVPNSEKSASLFPEYEVAIVRSTGHVSIITAAKVFETMESCQQGKDQANELVTEAYPNHKLSPQDFKYHLQSSNVYITLACSYINESPYPMLELQFRGKKEDITLKQAWEGYFQGRR